jgi:hypothetical protein
MSIYVSLESKLVFMKHSAVVHLPISEPTLCYDQCVSTNIAPGHVLTKPTEILPNFLFRLLRKIAKSNY